MRLDFDRHIARFLRRKFAAVVIDHTHLETRRWLAHRAGLHFQRGEISTEQHCFGLAIAIANSHPRALLPRSYYLWIEWLPRADTVPQRFRKIGFQIGQGFI